MEDELGIYVEEWGLAFESSGYPRIAGRILGLLLVCDPPYRSSDELVAELKVSKGSVSTMTRMLRSAGMLQPVAVPGSRATYFGIAHDGFERRFELVIENVSKHRALADRGLEILSHESPDRTKRLRQLRAINALFEREMPKLLQSWREERDSVKSEP